MSEWPTGIDDPIPLSSFSYLYPFFAGTGAYAGGITGQIDWPTSGRIIYTPIVVKRPFIVSRMSMPNGTDVTGPRDLGVYDLAGNRITSAGSHARAGINQNQTVDVSTATLAPGMYYLAAVINGDGNTYALAGALLGGSGFRTAVLNATGYAIEAVPQFPLPDTAAFASADSIFLPIVKIGNHNVNM